MRKLLLSVLVSIPMITYSQEFDKGKALFTTNCAGCHAMDKSVVGPALENVVELQGRDWTTKWISNSQELIASGDGHAVEVYEEYNKMVMPAFSYLKSDELSAIVDYLEGFKEDKKSQAAAAQAAAPADGEKSTTENGGGIPLHLKILIVLTLILLAVASIVIIMAFKVIDSYFIKMKVTNNELMKKLDLDTPEINKHVDDIFDKEVTKRVNEKVKTIKSDINDKL